MRWKSGEKAGIYTLTQPPSFDFPFSSEKIKCADEKGCAVVCKYKGWKEKRRWKDGEKAGIYTLTQPSSFGSSFSPEKKEHVHLYAHQKGSKTPGKQHSLLVLPFLWKKNVCIFIHVLHQVEYVHTWELKKKRQKGRKGGYLHSSVGTILWFFFFFCKNNVHTYPPTKSGRRPRKSGYFPFVLLFHLQKDMCIFIHIKHGTHMCRHGEGKEETEWAKRQVSTLLRCHLPLVFLFPLQ